MTVRTSSQCLNSIGKQYVCITCIFESECLSNCKVIGNGIGMIKIKIKLAKVSCTLLFKSKKLQ